MAVLQCWKRQHFHAGLHERRYFNAGPWRSMEYWVAGSVMIGIVSHPLLRYRVWPIPPIPYPVWVPKPWRDSWLKYDRYIFFFESSYWTQFRNVHGDQADINRVKSRIKLGGRIQIWEADPLQTTRNPRPCLAPEAESGLV